jgi:hypothetical protein
MIRLPQASGSVSASAYGKVESSAVGAVRTLALTVPPSVLAGVQQLLESRQFTKHVQDAHEGLDRNAGIAAFEALDGREAHTTALCQRSLRDLAAAAGPALSRPHRPRPDPASGSNGRCAVRSIRASSGTSSRVIWRR